MRLFFHFLIIYKIVICLGNWWQSIAAAEFWYDDEVHGSEVRTSTEDLQPREQNQRSAASAVMTVNYTFIQEGLKIAFCDT